MHHAAKTTAVAMSLLFLSNCGASMESETEATTDVSDLDTAVDAAEVEPRDVPALRHCPETGELATEDDCAFFTEVAQGAEEGRAAFNAPDPMYRGEEVPLQLVVSFAPPDEVIAAADQSLADAAAPDGDGRGPASIDEPRASDPPVEPAPPPPTPEDTVDPLPGNTVSFEPVVGRRMRAELTGVGFDIVAKSPASQAVSPSGQTVWTWAVTAKKAQDHVLTLTTAVEAVGSDGQPRLLISTSKSQRINVEVGMWRQLMEMLDAVPDLLKRITAVLLGLGALVGAWYALRRARRDGLAGLADKPSDPPANAG